MKTKLYLLILLALIFGRVGQHTLYAQGCVAVRQMGGNIVGTTNSYNLPKGNFQIGVGYRYFHSFRHFVGTEEQPHRQHTQGGFDANGNELGNAVNIYSHSIDLNISYALSNRLQLNLSLPYVSNERSQVLRLSTEGTILIDGKPTAHTKDAQRYSVYAQGVGDIRVSANYWLFDPANAQKGNLMLGLGVKTNSGSYTRHDDGIKAVDGQAVTDPDLMMDQAIQPGDGGIGISVEVQGFKKLYKGIYGFASGYYLFNPKESNGSFKSPPSDIKDQNGNVIGTNAGYHIYASPDQYLARAGVMTSVLKDKSLTFSLGARWEGIPAFDAFGGQVAYRRPGYVVAVEPGVAYTKGKHTFSLIVPFNFVRNRIQSAADLYSQNLQNSVITDQTQKVHVQGDAAFADHSINFTYFVRFGKNN